MELQLAFAGITREEGSAAAE